MDRPSFTLVTPAALIDLAYTAPNSIGSPTQMSCLGANTLQTHTRDLSQLWQSRNLSSVNLLDDYIPLSNFRGGRKCIDPSLLTTELQRCEKTPRDRLTAGLKLVDSVCVIAHNAVT